MANKKEDFERMAKRRREDAKLEAKLRKSGLSSDAGMAAMSKGRAAPPFNYEGEFVVGPLSPGESKSLSRVKLEALRRAKNKKKK